MKNRIIQKLDEFSKGQFDDMAHELIRYTGYEKPIFKERCGEILVQILHGYSHFSVSTIDSFFQKVIRSFAKEIGLAGSYRLELDFDLILIQIVDDLLLEATNNKQVLNWLIRFARENLQEGSNWDVRKNIRDLAQEIFNEHFKHIEQEIAEQDKGLTKKLKGELDEIIYEFEGKMDKLGTDGLTLLDKHGLSVSDFRGGKNGVANHLNKILKDSKKYEPTATLEKVVNGDQGWYTKSADNQGAMDAALADGLEAAIADSVQYYQSKYKLYSTALQIKKFIYGYGLLADLTRKLQDYKKDNDVMLISDATRFLKELVQDADTPFVYEKVGSFYKHYLIDEFQDTSGFQWDSFRPLVDDSLAQGYKNLVVGDIKQSIYRWRGGDWELLLNKIENDIGSQRTEHKVLDTNFRSEARVIHFNNYLFSRLPKALIREGGDVKDEQWQVLETVYEDTKQEIPKGKEEHGYINVTFLEDQDDWKWKEQVAEKLPVIVEELQDRGVALKDIAILVRRNKEGKEIADFLSEYEHSDKAKEGYRYEVVSNESLFLSSSAAVRTIVAALRYLSDQNDKVVRAELVYEYQRNIKNNEDALNDWFVSISQSEGNKWLPEAFLDEHKQLLYLPFYELVEHLIALFEVNLLPGQYAYLQTFQDLVLKFSQNEKGDITSFLEWWEERAGKESIKVADDLDAIRILTIHKAKGLEYKSVIVPFCDWEIDHKPLPPTMMWAKTDKKPFDVGHLPLIYKKELLNTYYAEDYEEEKIKAHLDNLNLLYVAFTRAAHNLWVFAPDGKKSIAKVLRRTLDDGDFELKQYWDDKANVFEYGSKDFQFDKGEEEVSKGIRLDTYQHFNWRNKITIKQSAKGFVEPDETRAKINYGILMHKLLSRIETLEDKERVINAIYYEEGLSSDQKKEVSKLIDDLLINEQASRWFSSDWKVYNEMSIITPEAEFRPDRVVVKDEETVIIDYKTGVRKDADKRQMLKYIELLENMGYNNVKAYLWYLAENEVEGVG